MWLGALLVRRAEGDLIAGGVFSRIHLAGFTPPAECGPNPCPFWVQGLSYETRGVDAVRSLGPMQCCWHPGPANSRQDT